MKNLSLFLMVLALPFMSFTNPDKGTTPSAKVKKVAKAKASKAPLYDGTDNILLLNNTPYTVNVDIKIQLGSLGAVQQQHYQLSIPANSNVTTPDFASTCIYTGGQTTTYMLIEWTSTGPAEPSSYQFFYYNGQTLGCHNQTNRNGALGVYLDKGCGTYRFLFTDSPTCQ